MPFIVVGGTRYQTADGENVLDAMLRHGIDAPYSCRRGTCHVCLLRSLHAPVQAAACAGLRDTLVEQGYFLACQCVPQAELTVEIPGASATSIVGLVRRRERLSEDVSSVLIEPMQSLAYRAGQFVNLRRSDGLMRSYSLASLPNVDPYLEFHIRRRLNGAMSNWLCDEVAVGDAIALDGPHGSSFYANGRPNDPLLLIGTGTGLAPLIGIVRDALARNHHGPIILYHGARAEADLYGAEVLGRLAAAHSNFRFTQCVSGDQACGDVAAGRADDVALGRHPVLAGWRVYLCGAPPMVHAARKRVFLARASLMDIFCDPFESKDLRQTPRASESVCEPQRPMLETCSR